MDVRYAQPPATREGRCGLRPAGASARYPGGLKWWLIGRCEGVPLRPKLYRQKPAGAPRDGKGSALRLLHITDASAR